MCAFSHLIWVVYFLTSSHGYNPRGRISLLKLFDMSSKGCTVKPTCQACTKEKYWMRGAKVAPSKRNKKWGTV
jgi:hypothetical protein